MKRLECMDGVRGVLAVYVMLGHAAPFAPLPHWIAHPVSHGQAAVDMFFMLSGLVIAGSLEKFHYRPRPFLIARVARLYPVFLVVYVFALLVQALPRSFDAMPWLPPDSLARLYWFEGFSRHWPIDVAAHLTMTHGLFPNGLFPDIWVSQLGAAWSLSTEWQFYVLALLLGGMLARRGIGLPTLGWLFIGIGAAGLAWYWLAPAPWQFSRAFIGNKGAYFGLGVLSAVLMRDGARDWRGYVLALGATLLILGGRGAPEKLLPPLVWTMCLAIQLAPAGGSLLAPFAAILRSRPAQALGAWSYGIYLVNEPMQKLVGGMLARWADGDAVLFTVTWIPLATITPVVAAAALHRWVEVPGQAWGRSWLRRPEPLAGGPALQRAP